MGISDAGPIESPPGCAIASVALLTALMQALIEQKILTPTHALHVVLSAQSEVGKTRSSPAHEDALVVLNRLVETLQLA